MPHRIAKIIHKHFLWSLMLCAYCFCNNAIFAQTGGDTFVPQSKIIFYDDFSGTNPGKFPGKWTLAKCNGGDFLASIQQYKVHGADYSCFLETNAYDPPLIEPNIYYRTAYLSNEFTVEYDFAFTDTAEKIRQCLHFVLPGRVAGCEQVLFRISNTETNDILLGYETKFPRKYKKETTLRTTFDFAKWHHFALSFRQRQIHWYIDNKLVLTIDTCGYSPIRIALHSAFSKVKYRNVKVAIKPRNNSLDSILTGNTLYATTYILM